MFAQWGGITREVRMKRSKVISFSTTGVVILVVGGVCGFLLARSYAQSIEKADVNRTFQNVYVDLSEASKLIHSADSNQVLDAATIIRSQKLIGEAEGLMDGVSGETQRVTGVPQNTFWTINDALTFVTHYFLDTDALDSKNKSAGTSASIHWIGQIVSDFKPAGPDFSQNMTSVTHSIMKQYQSYNKTPSWASQFTIN